MAAASPITQADIDKAVAQLDGLRATSPNVLFFIARSKNLNIVVYEGMKAGSTIDAKKPVDVYWLDIDPEYVKANRKKGIQTDRSDLNMIENKMAYGISCEAVSGKAETYFCRLVALSSKPVTVTVNKEGKFHGTIEINGKQAELVRIYVHAVDRTLLPPKVTYVDVIGRDPETGAYVSQRINP